MQFNKGSRWQGNIGTIAGSLIILMTAIFCYGIIDFVSRIDDKLDWQINQYDLGNKDALESENSTQF